jgi:hypothetical protein
MTQSANPDLTPPSAATQPKRQSVLAERFDLAIAWCVSTLAGAAMISLLSRTSDALRTTLPVIVMMTYLAIALTRSRFSTSKVADSVYFMGFLWTLWALIDVLIRSQGLNASRLYLAFGHALTCTAAGMFLRLAVIQFFRTVEDQEEQAVDAIDQRVTALAIELDRARQHVASLRGAAVAELQRWNAAFEKETERHRTALADGTAAFVHEGQELTASLKAVRGSVSATGRAFSDLQKRLDTSTTRLSAQIGSTTTALEGAMSELRTRVAAIQIPKELLTGPIEQLVGDARKALEPLQILTAQTFIDLKRAVQTTAEAVAKLPGHPELEAGLKQTTAQLNVVVGACSELAANASSTAAAFLAVNEAVRSTQAVAATAGKGLDSGVREVERALQGAQTAARSVEAGTQKANESIKEVVRFVQTQLVN